MKNNLFDFLKEHNVEIQVNTNCPKCDFDYLSLKTNEVHVCGENRVVNVIDPKLLNNRTKIYIGGDDYGHLDMFTDKCNPAYYQIPREVDTELWERYKKLREEFDVIHQELLGRFGQ